MVGRKTRIRRGRRYLAAVTCVLWLLGVEVLPNLHLAFHDDHHSHAADGTIVHDAVAADDRDHDHDHDALADDAHHHHSHHHPHGAAPADGDALVGEGHDTDADLDDGGSPSPGPDDQLAIDHRSSAHAAAGIAHHAIALHRPPPPLLEPLAVVRTTWRIEVALDDQLSHAPLARPTARGPPATA